MTKRIKYTAIWKEPIEIVKESRLSFFCITFPASTLLFLPSQSSWILIFRLLNNSIIFPLVHLLIYSIYFPSPNTLTSYRSYIDPTSTLDFFNTTSWIEKLYRTTTTFLLFSLHHHHHHHILLFSRHHHHHQHITIFHSTTTTTTTMFLLFSLSHISFVFPSPPPPPPPPAHHYNNNNNISFICMTIIM